jgi:hypothetical protein
MWLINKLTLLLFANACLIAHTTPPFDVIYAVNAGGDEHKDVYEINYEKDNTIGHAIDVGSEDINNVAHQDQIIYKTIAHSPTTFGYNLPIINDGMYWLNLKFFNYYKSCTSGDHLFNVFLNGHAILESFDICQNNVNDELIYFSVCNRIVKYNQENSTLSDEFIRLEFAPVNGDAMVSAIVLLQGHVSDIAKITRKDYIINEKYVQQAKNFQCECDSTNHHNVHEIITTALMGLCLIAIIIFGILHAFYVSLDVETK